jgi:endonuclease/exonuclease/phosphatase family metal-dependent hydrolase
MRTSFFRVLTILAAGVALGGCAAGHEMDVRAPVGACASSPGAQVAWARPVSEGEQARLDDWCSAAGEPVVLHASTTQAGPEAVGGTSRGGGPAPTGESILFDARFEADLAPVDSLIVATWNVEVGTGDLVRLLEDRLGHVCSSASGNRSASRVPFVLLVQEAYRASHDIPEIPDGVALPSRIGKSARHGERTDIVKIAAECNLSLFYAPSMRNGAEDEGQTPEDRGNAILASVPLTDLAAIELPLETQRRVAVAAIAHPPGRDPIRVVSFHLDVAANLLRVLTTGNSTRLRQGLGLAGALQELDTGDTRLVTVIGGDVNSWSEKETVIRHLSEQFPDSPEPTSEGTRGSYPTDHMFVRTFEGSNVSVADNSYRVIPDTYGSDHRGKLLTLRFESD